MNDDLKRFKLAAESTLVLKKISTSIKPITCDVKYEVPFQVDIKREAMMMRVIKSRKSRSNHITVYRLINSSGCESDWYHLNDAGGYSMCDAIYNELYNRVYASGEAYLLIK